MGPLRPLTARAERHVLRRRTHRGRATVVRYLDLLAVAMQARGYRCVKLYQARDLPAPPPPVLWVMAFSPSDHVRAAITVHAAPGDTWAYHHQTGPGHHVHLTPCGDTEHAADRVDALLKHLMFPATW